MPDSAALVTDLMGVIEHAASRARQDPFGNPVRDAALAIERMLHSGDLRLDALTTFIKTLRDRTFRQRAARIASYVGGVDRAATLSAMRALSERIASQPIESFKDQVERTRFAAVFTAHPTFSMPANVGHNLAQLASGEAELAAFESHRPKQPTLTEELDQAMAAMIEGRDAIDALTSILLDAARAKWPDDWSSITPSPIALASWVGYDTDGRTDISWWDTLRIALHMKHAQLDRLLGQIKSIPQANHIRGRLEKARQTVCEQRDACPTGPKITPEQAAELAGKLVDGRAFAITEAASLLPDFDAAIAATSGADKQTLCVARSGLATHGVALAQMQFRLNATQLHNAIRQYVDIDVVVGDASRRRALLAEMNAALDKVVPTNVDFGGLFVEPTSATKTIMLLAQILKFVDAESPIRLHIAETESGFTLLCALWLLRLFGIDDKVQISPLFETADALENGSRILDEALRSRHWQAYLRRTGVLAIEFGYSDSGRYVGQMAATYLVERQRLKIAEVLRRYDLSAVEIIIFDTHGESVGRGASPKSLNDRLKFLNPTRSRKELARAGLRVREESAFQGGDGYVLFGTQELALATIARIAEHAFNEDALPDAHRLPPDPIYDDPDFAADFFGITRREMEELVEDRGYADLLGTFGPALLDPTGSRPSARQLDGLGGPATIRHPRELRAIPNNAILQQIGWMANTLHGLGAALEQHPEAFTEFMERSARFRRALDFAEHALRHSDLNALGALTSMFDPGFWLSRAQGEKDASAREAFIQVSTALEELDISPALRTTFRRIQADDLALRTVWTDAPHMATEEVLLHAIRQALIQRIWLLAARIPDFSPRHGVTRTALIQRVLRLDVPATVKLLNEIFPAQPNTADHHDYHEPRGFWTRQSYAHEHDSIFEPMEKMFALIREAGMAITHAIGAFG